MSSIQPGNPSEWQLYRVLQRSNLLQYYDTFIAQGKSLRSRIMCNLDLVIQNKLYILRYLRSCFYYGMSLSKFIHVGIVRRIREIGREKCWKECNTLQDHWFTVQACKIKVSLTCLIHVKKTGGGAKQNAKSKNIVLTLCIILQQWLE